MVKLDQQEATKQFQTGWFHKVPRNLIFLKVIAWLHLIMIMLLANPEFPFVQLPLILGPAIFQMNSLRLTIIQKNCFNYTGFVQKLDNIRNQDGTYFDKVYDTHYQMLCNNLDKYMSLVYQEQNILY